MKGRNHLILTWLSISPTLLVFIEQYPIEIFLLYASAGLGALTPDVDTKSSTLFKGGRNLNTGVTSPYYIILGPLLTPFAYMMRYLVVFPAKIFTDSISGAKTELKHRNFTHGLPSMLVSSTLLSTYTVAAVLAIGLKPHPLLMVIGVGFVFGYLMHLIQDSVTRSGVDWLNPFYEFNISGRLVTGGSPKSVGLLNFLLIMASSLSVSLAVGSSLPKIMVAFLGAGLTIGIWLGLCFTILDVSVE